LQLLATSATILPPIWQHCRQ